MAASGRLDQRAAFGLPWRSAEVDHRQVGIAAQDLGLGRVVEQEPPLAVDTGRQLGEVGAEGEVQNATPEYNVDNKIKQTILQLADLINRKKL